MAKLIWGMSQWNIPVWCPHWAPYLCWVLSPRILYLLCLCLAFSEIYEKHYPILPYILFICIIILSSWSYWNFPRTVFHLCIHHSAFCIISSEAVLSRIFVHQTLKGKVWYLNYIKHFRKTQRKGKQSLSQQMYVFRFPVFSVPESRPKHCQFLFCK